jgi:uncharacterized membrane protein
MKAKLLTLLETLRANFWFIPAIMAGGAIILAFGMIAIDQLFQDTSYADNGWIYGGGAEGARALLSTVAGSIINVTGVTFSITIAVLTLASNQFGPRLLRNFVRDRGNQFVLGTFIATFIYCLLVLRTIRGQEEVAFVPHFSTTLGVVLAVVSLGVLIYFIHHIATSIQAEQIIASVSHDLHEAIDHFFPEKGDAEEREPPEENSNGSDRPDRLGLAPRAIEAAQSGYIQAIDIEGLLEIAIERDLVVQLVHRPGHYVVRRRDVALVWPGRSVDGEVVERINDAIILGSQRTQTQDVEFSLNQLVEIAVRALSPSLNDPFTAISCIDRLGSALCHVTERALPAHHYYDDQGTLRLLTVPVTFEGIVDAAFNKIRQNGRSSAAVTIRLLETISVIAAHTHDATHHAALLRQAEMIERGSREGLPEPCDREDVAEFYREVLRTIERQPVAR